MPRRSRPRSTLIGYAFVAALGLVATACSSSSSAASAPPGDSTEDCVCPTGDDGGTCVCHGVSWTACDAKVSESLACNPGVDVTSLGCYQGSAMVCGCGGPDSGFPDAGPDGGPGWNCSPTEHACTGGTF